MYCIHFRLVVRGQCLEISVHPAQKHCTVFELCIVALTRFEFHLTFENDVPCSKETIIQISVKSPDGHSQFWVVTVWERGCPWENSGEMSISFCRSSCFAMLIPERESVRNSLYSLSANLAS